MARRPTIIDVAREAGVSKSTVSLVLRDSAALKPATREAVRAAMARLGYVYNRSAAQLRSSSAGLVGLVINDLRNPFFTEFATSLQMALAAQRFATVIANTDENPALQEDVVSAMIEHGVSALVISPAYGGDGKVFDRLARAQIPVIQVLRKVDPRTDEFPFAAPDYPAGGRLAARHLAEAGCRRIAFVGGIAERGVTRERMAGYLELEGRALVIPGRASRAFGREAAAFLEREHADVDGVICFNDLVALGLLSGLEGRPVRVVGFDGIEECAQANPPLSSVSCGIAGFGVAIAATVIDWLARGVRPVPELRSAVELIVRESSRR